MRMLFVLFTKNEFGPDGETYANLRDLVKGYQDHQRYELCVGCVLFIDTNDDRETLNSIDLTEVVKYLAKN